MEQLEVVVPEDVERSALGYTLDLFRECTGGRFACRVRHSGAPGREACLPTIYYGCKPPADATGVVVVPHRDLRSFEGTVMLHLGALLGRGSDDSILAYTEAVTSPERPLQHLAERRHLEFGCDLFSTAFAFAVCLEERAHESTKGPIHGYAQRLNRDPERFRRPWAEVIFSALARSLELAAGRDDLFESHGNGSVHLGHDVDVAGAGLLKRTKQSAFDALNAGRELLAGRPLLAAMRVSRGLRLPFSRGGFLQFDRIRAVEERADLRSTFYVYAGTPRRGLSRRLRRTVFDPQYDICRNKELLASLRDLLAGGWSVGLHASYDAFEDAELLAAEKYRLEEAIEHEVKRVRNHWLRFSLSGTWRAQAEAGLSEDATLGFNDALGFRAGLARPFVPFDPERREQLPIRAVPVVAMDSTLFDYLLLSGEEAERRCLAMLSEVDSRGGEAGVSWHVHGFSKVLGWGDSYERLLKGRAEEALVG